MAVRSGLAGGGWRRRRRLLPGLLLTTLAFPPSAAIAVDAMDGGPPAPDRRAARTGATGSQRGIERLRVDLRPGGGLELSLTPDTVAEPVAWEDGDMPAGASTAAGLGPVPFQTPEWLRLSGTLEPSGLGLELGTVGLEPPEWHGLSGVWRIDLDTRLASTVPFEQQFLETMGAEYGLAVPLTAVYGPLSLQTRLLGADWRSDGDEGEGVHLQWPPDTVRLNYRFPDPLAYLGSGDTLTLRTEAGAAFGAEPEPLSLRSRLAWQPWAYGADDWLSPRLELELRADDRPGSLADLGLRARLGFGTRELLPGRHLELVLEYTNEDLLRRFYDAGGTPGDQLAAVRLSF